MRTVVLGVSSMPIHTQGAARFGVAHHVGLLALSGPGTIASPGPAAADLRRADGAGDHLDLRPDTVGGGRCDNLGRTRGRGSRRARSDLWGGSHESSWFSGTEEMFGEPRRSDAVKRAPASRAWTSTKRPGGRRRTAEPARRHQARVCLNADKQVLPTLLTRPTSLEMTHPEIC